MNIVHTSGNGLKSHNPDHQKFIYDKIGNAATKYTEVERVELVEAMSYKGKLLYDTMLQWRG